MSFRVGIGYDIHRVGGVDRPLVLGGMLIPDAQALEGHSDADVVLHAIIDAILGAAALGDIGQHFPPTDPAYRNADSRDLLAQTLRLMNDHGYQVDNVDVTVVAERPRLGQYIGTMRARIADDLAVTVDEVSIKAKTNEGLGAIGRGEAIAAYAVALLSKT
jgi:2-C-methyl-D-erythritol 2,4-cyclodiphosphate synthase